MNWFQKELQEVKAEVATWPPWKRDSEHVCSNGLLPSNKPETEPPKCHFTPMSLEWADDGCQQVEYWECKHCGHTKEASRVLAG